MYRSRNFRKTKQGMARIIALIWLIAMQIQLLLPKQAFAIDFEVIIPEEARQGTVIAMKINFDRNEGLTTLGLRVCYEPEILSYKGVQWSDSFINESNRQGLVSDVEYQGGRTVNISFIDTTEYTENGVLLTVYFEVMQDYFENPVSLMLRDATDGNGQILSGSTKMVYVGGMADYSNLRNILAMGMVGMFVVFGGIALCCTIWKSRLRANVRRERKEILGY